jgi:hypothetical protein
MKDEPTLGEYHERLRTFPGLSHGLGTLQQRRQIRIFRHQGRRLREKKKKKKKIHNVLRNRNEENGDKRKKEKEEKKSHNH